MKKWMVFVLILCLAAGLVWWMGVGPRYSSAAAADLRLDLENVHGPEYQGKTVENGTEDMVFSIEPKTWFLTNWNLREMLGLDYAYECKVIFTTHTGEGRTLVRTITYQATDPMGKDATTARAHLDLDSKTETTEQK